MIRLIFDHDTNRPKGFAFCEYPGMPVTQDDADPLDIATAGTAVRNLNGYDIGTRQLRVDFSEKEGTSKASTTTSDVHSSWIFRDFRRYNQQICCPFYQRGSHPQREFQFQTLYPKHYKLILPNN